MDKTRCDVKSFLGTVTKWVEVDDMPRHVRDLRMVATPLPPPVQNPLAVEKQSLIPEDDELPITIRIPTRAPEDSNDQHPDDDDESGRPLTRQFSREHRPASRPF